MSVDATYVQWLEDELMEFLRLSSQPMPPDDALTDHLRLHGMRLMVEADIANYTKAMHRWEQRRKEKP